MSGASPIASGPIGAEEDDEEIIFTPVSRNISGGAFTRPAVVPTVRLGIQWDDNSLILWDDNTAMIWD